MSLLYTLADQINYLLSWYPVEASSHRIQNRAHEILLIEKIEHLESGMPFKHNY